MVLPFLRVRAYQDYQIDCYLRNARSSRENGDSTNEFSLASPLAMMNLQLRITWSVIADGRRLMTIVPLRRTSMQIFGMNARKLDAEE